jgi:hypothetical protein
MGATSSAAFGTLTTNDFCKATSGTAIACTTAPTGSGNVVLATSPTLISPTISSGGLTVSAGGANITGTVTGTTFSGSGASLTNIGTNNLTAVTGTPDSTKFLRGDGKWAAPTSGDGDPLSGAAGGDLAGTYPDPIVTNINGVALGSTAATAGNLLIGSGTAWNSTPVSGDITLSSTGAAAITAHAVARNNLSKGAALSVIGNASNASANVADIAGAANQVLVVNPAGTSLGFDAVNLASSAAVSGNLPVTNLNNGTNASSSTFWRGDGTWATVSTGLPALSPAKIWVGNGSSVATAVALTGDCTISSAGAITCTSGLPALSPSNIWVVNGSSAATAVALTGDCAISSAGTIICTKTNGSPFAASATTDATNAGNISSGTLNTARLGTGTADTTTFLRGDKTWAVPSGSGTIHDAGSATSIDWSQGSQQYTSANCGAFTFTNMVDGGVYTLAVRGSVSATCSFSQTGLTFKLPPGHGATIASTHTLYSFVRMGTFVYVSWIVGL